MASLMQRWKDFVEGAPPAVVDPASIHISQVGDELFNPSAANATANCGPTAVIMAVRLLGRDVPGSAGLRGEALVRHVRKLATGNTNTRVGTNNLHLQRVIEQSGCAHRVIRDPREMLRAVAKGQPVIMAGNPTVKGGYTERFDYIDIRRWDSGHWIVVSRYNPDRHTFTVNDPQSVIGPIEATVAELVAFSSKDGDFGIAVRRV